MIAHRNRTLYAILSLVTFGVWGLVWFFQIGDDNPSALIDLLLAIVTCGIWGIILGYTWGDTLTEGLRNSGRPTNENLPILTLILGIFGLHLVSFALWQVELNKAAAK